MSRPVLRTKMFLPVLEFAAENEVAHIIHHPFICFDHRNKYVGILSAMDPTLLDSIIEDMRTPEAHADGNNFMISNYPLTAIGEAFGMAHIKFNKKVINAQTKINHSRH